MSDPHSYADPTQRTVEHVSWTVSVDLDRHVLDAVAVLHLASGSGPVDLDTRDLEIHRIDDGAGRPVPWLLAPPDPVLGSRLRVEPTGDVVRIAYATSPASSALQWLAPEQTADGTHPYVYSQSQTIHARSMLPVPDSPACRFTYDAQVDVPEAFTVLMAATAAPEGPVSTPDRRRTFRFTQERPVPAYLVALVAGVLTSRDLSPRSRVWAERSVVDAATWEFAEVEHLLTAAEQVLGPFPWDRADLLLMPPSYPYGGMENPGLMFLTPTLLAGDRSLVGVLAHEIVHHWTGDTVTCASLEHFWLNEGLTVFAERQVTARVEGPEVAEIQAAVGRANLEDDLRYLADRPELTRLRLDLRGLDPDVTSSWAALEKGYLFVRAIEDAVGPERLAAFLPAYVVDHAFRSLTGEDFVAYARERLGEVVDWDTWLHGTGLPAGTPDTDSPTLRSIRAIGDVPPDRPLAEGWSADHWQAYLAQLSSPADVGLLTTLDDAYGLTSTGNHDVLSLWLLLGIRSGYAPATDATVGLVSRMGRLKDLKTLYVALAERADTRALALTTFAANRERYHPIAVTVVEARLRALTEGATA
ncbi:MAG: M1 family metallopeptidase [Janthinobacterium lividum]